MTVDEIRHEIWRRKLKWKALKLNDSIRLPSGHKIKAYMGHHLGNRAVAIVHSGKIVAITYFGMERGPLPPNTLLGRNYIFNSSIGFHRAPDRVIDEIGDHLIIRDEP